MNDELKADIVVAIRRMETPDNSRLCEALRYIIERYSEGIDYHHEHEESTEELEELLLILGGK
jgi:hypothetical protein